MATTNLYCLTTVIFVNIYIAYEFSRFEFYFENTFVSDWNNLQRSNSFLCAVQKLHSTWKSNFGSQLIIGCSEANCWELVAWTSSKGLRCIKLDMTGLDWRKTGVSPLPLFSLKPKQILAINFITQNVRNNVHFSFFVTIICPLSIKKLNTINHLNKCFTGRFYLHDKVAKANK